MGSAGRHLVSLFACRPEFGVDSNCRDASRVLRLERTVNEKTGKIVEVLWVNRNLPGFPNVSSTRLYPEWSFSALPHVDDNLARKVVALLFILSETDPATVKAIGIQGFSIPANYLPVGKMLETLRAPPFDTAPEFTTGDVFKRYKWPIAAAAVMMLALVSLGFALLINNRRLFSERAKVEKQAQLLTESEAKLQSLVDSSATDIFWSNEAGVIEYTNDQFTNVTRWVSCSQDIRRPMRFLYSSPPVVGRSRNPIVRNVDDVPRGP